MLPTTARLAVTAAALALAAPAWAQDATTETPDLSGVQTAIDAATSAGLLETLTSGEAYTAFIPTNEAIESQQEAATAAMEDQAGLATLIQGYVIPGNVLAADAMTLVTDGGGTTTVDSLAGTPIELAMDGETLTVNGAPVTTPDLQLGNVTVHVIDGVYLPEGGDAAASEGG
jgi:uncharacterized surface protein with fasciclin (FAS1) repeats